MIVKKLFNRNIILIACIFCSCNINTEKKIKILVKDPIVNKTICLDVTNDSTIKDLKNVLYDKTGISPENLVLYSSNNKIINDQSRFSFHDINFIRCNLKLNGGLIDGPCPGKHYRKKNKTFSDPKKNLKPGLNVELYCRKCRDSSTHGWGFEGINLDKDTGFNGHDILNRSRCQYCFTAVEDSDDQNGDEQVKVLSISFYQCKFDFHGKVDSYSLNKWGKAAKVQTEITYVSGDDCVTYYSDEFLKWSSMKIRTCGAFSLFSSWLFSLGSEQ